MTARWPTFRLRYDFVGDRRLLGGERAAVADLAACPIVPDRYAPKVPLLFW